jgi:hypothetical protein
VFLAEAYELDYIIFKKSKQLDLEIVYENEEFIIYKIK